jgi:hypothetical protein
VWDNSCASLSLIRTIDSDVARIVTPSDAQDCADRAALVRGAFVEFRLRDALT